MSEQDTPLAARVAELVLAGLCAEEGLWTQDPPTVRYLSLWRGDMLVTRLRPQPTMRGIAEHVAARYGLTPADLRGPSRARPIVRPRQEAMWLMRQVMKDGRHRYSLPMIGDFLGFRDHTTILAGVRQHQKRLTEAESAS